MCSGHTKYTHIPSWENKIHLGTVTTKPINQLEELISCDPAEHQLSLMVVAASWGWKQSQQEVAASPNLPCPALTCADGLEWPCLDIRWVCAGAQERLDVSPKIKIQRGDVHLSFAGITLPCCPFIRRHVRCSHPYPAPPSAVSWQTGCFRCNFPIGSKEICPLR